MTIEQRLEQLERSIQALTHRIAAMEGRGMVYGPITPVQPIMPSFPPGYEPKFKCHKCGLEMKGAMGYSCPRADCPCQPKVTMGDLI